MRKIFTLLLIIILFTCTSLLGETKDKKTEEAINAKGKLAGKVTDDKGNPIPNANISILMVKLLSKVKRLKKMVPIS